MNRRTLGDMEEIIAIEYLEKNGYQILERNFRCRTGEIDIVALHEGYLVFIEVKYRSNLQYGEPAYAIGKNKQRTLYRTAEFYLLKNKISPDTKVRFDAVLILKNNINIIKNAFGAM